MKKIVMMKYFRELYSCFKRKWDAFFNFAGVFLVFLLISFVITVGLPILLIGCANAFTKEMLEFLNPYAFWIGIVTFFSAKLVDLFQCSITEKYSLRVFIPYFFDAITPAMFIFGMYNYDVWWYLAVSFASCVIMALVYRNKIYVNDANRNMANKNDDLISK